MIFESGAEPRTLGLEAMRAQMVMRFHRGMRWPGATYRYWLAADPHALRRSFGIEQEPCLIGPAIGDMGERVVEAEHEPSGRRCSAALLSMLICTGLALSAATGRSVRPLTTPTEKVWHPSRARARSHQCSATGRRCGSPLAGERGLAKIWQGRGLRSREATSRVADGFRTECNTTRAVATMPFAMDR